LTELRAGDLVAIREDVQGPIGNLQSCFAGKCGIVLRTGTQTYVDEEMEHHTHDWADVLIDAETVRVSTPHFVRLDSRE
jgi:hypothetical protein